MANAKAKSVYSKVSVKSQTVLPREVRERLRIAPGDHLRYIFDESGIRLEKGSARDDGDPFVSFTEWATAQDDKAFEDL